MHVIALDGAYVERSTFDSVILTPGERVDFILDANNTVGNYWINISTLNGDNSPAVLSYEGAPDPLVDPKFQNPQLSLGCQLGSRVGVLDSKLQTLQPHHIIPSPPKNSNKQFVMHLIANSDPAMDEPRDYLGQNYVKGVNGNVKPLKGCPQDAETGQPSKYCWTINWVPFAFAKNDTPLVFPGALAQATPQTYVEYLGLGDVVDIAFINPSMMVHPMHLHGQRFWVLGTGHGSILDGNGRIMYDKLNTKNPPMRDTQPVPENSMGMSNDGGSVAKPPPSKRRSPPPKRQSPPPNREARPPKGRAPPLRNRMPPMQHNMDHNMDQAPPPSMGGMIDPHAGHGRRLQPMAHSEGVGYSVIRFKASNPGVWSLHCHTETHAMTGMFMAFVVPSPNVTVPWSLPTGVVDCGRS